MRSGDGPGADELVRWRETSMDASALPARAADLVDAARDAPTLSPATLTRIYADLAGGQERRGSVRGRGLPRGLRLAAAAALIVVSVATAKGAMTLWHRYVAPAVEPLRPSDVAQSPRQRVAVAAPKAPAEPAPGVEPIAADAPGGRPATIPASEPLAVLAPSRAVPAARPRHAPGSARSSTSAARGADAPGGARPEPEVSGAAGDGAPRPADAANESQLLADALALLRQRADPQGALALLDQYARSYPRGVLASEARSARLEALLGLDDRAGALDLLDQRTTFSGRLGADQLLTRAELRASAGRYADALRDFDRLLAPSGGLAAPGGALQRALYGRAVTLGHLGRDERAREDLEEYRRRFPAGPHAREVERLLRGAP